MGNDSPWVLSSPACRCGGRDVTVQDRDRPKAISGIVTGVGLACETRSFGDEGRPHLDGV